MGDSESNPSDAVVERKRAELMAKASSLRQELQHWSAMTAEQKTFTKHRSQVERIRGRLEGKLAAVDRQLANTQALLGSAYQIQTDLLQTYALWEFFRSKLILRADSFLGDYLRVCDELAWACYEPLQKLYKQNLPAQDAMAKALQVKEPPFVFLNGAWSPYAVGRDKSFSVELGAGGWPVPGQAQRIVDKLPVPVVGVPWYQVSHLPDALVIEHEMGHVAEWDFQLTAATVQALQGAGTQDLPGWISWRAEVFADIYGCLAGGPSFVRSLVDFLVSEVANIQSEKRMPGIWGQYPPTWLRVVLVTETLARRFPAEAQAIQDDWDKKYGVPSELEPWKVDVPKVVSALCQGPYATLGGVKLEDVLSFPAENGVARDIQVAGQIPGNFPLSDASPRVLLGAGRRLYDKSPTDFIRNNTAALVRDTVIKNIPPGTRGTPPADLNAMVAAETELASTNAADLFS